MTEDEMREAAAVAHRNAHGAAYGRDAMPLEWWRKQASWKHEIAATNAALAIAIPWAREQALREAAKIAFAEISHNAIEKDDPISLREMKVVAIATARGIYDEVLALIPAR